MKIHITHLQDSENIKSINTELHQKASSINTKHVISIHLVISTFVNSDITSHTALIRPACY